MGNEGPRVRRTLVDHRGVKLCLQRFHSRPVTRSLTRRWVGEGGAATVTQVPPVVNNAATGDQAEPGKHHRGAAHRGVSPGTRRIERFAHRMDVRAEHDGDGRVGRCEHKHDERNDSGGRSRAPAAKDELYAHAWDRHQRQSVQTELPDKGEPGKRESARERDQGQQAKKDAFPECRRHRPIVANHVCRWPGLNGCP